MRAQCHRDWVNLVRRHAHETSILPRAVTIKVGAFRPRVSALAHPSILHRTRGQPAPRGVWTCWANTGPISLSSHGVMWRFLAVSASLDGASSDRFEQAWEGSIPFLGTRFRCSGANFDFRWANTSFERRRKRGR